MARKLPPTNGSLTAIAHVETQNVGGELIEVLVTDWTGSADCYVQEETKFGDITGGAISTDDTTTIVVPYDLVAAQAPGFTVDYVLRFTQRGVCTTAPVKALESKPDFGFVRCVADPGALDPEHDLCP